MPAANVRLPGTVAANIHRFTGRAWLLPRLLEWWEAGNERLFLLTGAPGTGKSMILAWLAGFGPEPQDRLARKQLARLRNVVQAAHFCHAASRNISPHAFAESIANQLSPRLSGFAEALAAERVQIVANQNIGTVQSGGTVTGVSIGRIDMAGMGDELSFDRVFVQPLKRIYASGHPAPMLLLVDALDEAQSYGGVTLADLLSRIDDLPAGVRILATTRDEPRTLKFFRGIRPLNLTGDAPRDLDDLRTYTMERAASLKRFPRQRREEFADRLAKQAAGVFLYAAIVLDEISQRTPAELPDLDAAPLPDKLSGLYHQFLIRELGRDDRRWFELYEPLLGLIGAAQGDGLTAGELTGMIGRDVRGEIRASKQYLSGDLPDGPFRPFHQSFADFLFEDEGNLDFRIDANAMHSRIVSYFEEHCQNDWQRGDDYALRYLAIHAAKVGRLERLAANPAFLAAAEPEGLLEVFVAHARELPRDLVHVYEAAAHHLSTVSRAERASYLEMAARQNGLEELADRFGQLPLPRPFSVMWADWQATSLHRVLSANLGREVTAVTSHYEGRTVAVAGGNDGAVRVLDVTTGRQAREPLRGDADAILAVTAADFDGRTTIASSAKGGAIQIRDCVTGLPIAGPVRSRSYGGAPARALSLNSVDGRRVLVAGGSHGNVEVWDLATGEHLGKPMMAYGGVVHWVGISRREGRPVILALYNDRMLRVWDFATGQLSGEAIPTGCHDFSRVAIAMSRLDGADVVIAGGGDGCIRAWDIATGKPVMEPLQAHTNAISALATGEISGVEALVSGDNEGTIRTWRLAERRMTGESVRQHDGGINSLAVGALNGVAVVVSAGGDGTVRVSEVTDLPPEVKHSGERGTSVYALAVTEWNGRPVVVTGGWNGAIRVRDLATGRPEAALVQAHSTSIQNVIATGTGNSRWIVSAADESTLDVQDAQTGERIGERLYGTESDRIWNLGAHATIPSSGGGFWKKGAAGTFFVADEALPGRKVGMSRGRGRVVLAANLSTGQVIRRPIVGTNSGCLAVTVATVQGRTMILTADIGGAIEFWDLETGERAWKSLNNRIHVNALDAAELDGRPIVVSGHNDGTVRLWDPVSGLPIGEELSGEGAVRLLDMARIDGRLVLGCLRGDTIDFTDLASLRPFSPTLNPGYSTSLAFCEFEKRLAVVTASYTGPLKIWDAAGVLQVAIDLDASISDLAVAPGWTGVMPGLRILVGSSKGLMALEWRPSSGK